MAFNTITVTTSATLIVAQNTRRRNLTIVNNSSNVLYIGPDATITTSNAIPLFGRSTRNDDKIPEGYLGDIYGIVASGTIDARFWETVNS